MGGNLSAEAGKADLQLDIVIRFADLLDNVATDDTPERSRDEGSTAIICEELTRLRQ